MLTADTILQNRYVIVRQIGQGGMGAVYLAKDQRLNNLIALKETLTHSESLRKAFEREAQLLANLRHPALPVVSDHFIEGNGQFLVMQYIPGEDLEELISKKRKPFDLQMVMQWADQLLDALEYLHTQTPPVIHRDIKPHNLKLTERGEIVLLDFGLAKGAAADMSASAGLSVHGYTPNYAPVEQIQSKGTDARSDVYSLGATLYYLLTAHIPSDALSRVVALAEGAADPLKPADEINSQIPSGVASVLRVALAVNREQRFGRASEMRKALRSATSLFPSEYEEPATPLSADTIVGNPYGGDRKDRAAALKETAATLVLESDSAAMKTRLPASDTQSTAGKRWLWLIAAGIALLLLASFAIRRQWFSGDEAKALQPFEFESATINFRAEITDRRKGQARHFREDLGDGLALEMVEIGGGTFLMGSPDYEEGRDPIEGPQHQVSVPSFFIGQFEITQSQWRAVAKSLPKVNRDLITDPSYFKGDNLPVEQVSYEDAEEFCARLAAKTGRLYRLPSEAEWEYACRAGATTAFAFGENISGEIVNYNGDGPYRNAPKALYRDEPTAVGSLGVANAFGLFDLHGNVWEWTADDWHDSYQGAPTDGSVWRTNGDAKAKALRGGSWYVVGGYCRSANRYKRPVDDRNFNTGFRVAVAKL